MKQATNTRSKVAQKCIMSSLDGVMWATDHIKEIGVGLGLLGLAAVSHRMGYRKALRDALVLVRVDTRRSTPRHAESFDYIMRKEIK